MYFQGFYVQDFYMNLLFELGFLHSGLFHSGKFVAPLDYYQTTSNGSNYNLSQVLAPKHFGGIF